MIFAWIEERRGEYPIAALCRALGVSRSGYYARANRPRSPTAVRRDELVGRMRAVHAEVRGRYGSPRLAVELKARGVACCVNTVAKAMKAHGLRAKTVKRFVRTTDSNHRHPVSENVLDRGFTAAGPNEKWAMDITYIPTLEGWLFLALVVDLFSRRIVGWAMAEAMTSRLVVDALDLAVGQRDVPAGLIAHSDRESPYASAHYQAELRRHGMVWSMSGVGQCWDNAVVESTFGRLKQELVHGETYATRDAARASIFEYVEVFYNRVRRHSTLGYVSPAEFERTHDPNNR
ncbi:IS3 family transposase [Limnoglobus roseus]|uniref:IS3 family transposase n=1 Tax=Limnoglobus roseus TaxID=2598579 RepID=A0A5C1AIP8_9BACT|nr:IS3 family transposase [Limnoglobus roseus]QEL16848.1 IS3 family transposase [Limnoglobus roseus]